MAAETRRRGGASRTMLVGGLLGLCLVGAACGPTTRVVRQGPIRDFAAELRATAEQIGKRFGLPAKKVEDDIREANPRLTEEGLLDVANTAKDFWEPLDKMIQAAEVQSRLVIGRSTCHWLMPSSMSKDARNADLQNFIRSQPGVAGLADPEAKVDEVIEGVVAQMERMEARGITDRAAMFEEAACWIFGLGTP